jgi:predicted DNA-binding transcriptional regulator AlpA
MSLDNSSPNPQTAEGNCSRRVVLSPWVNEHFPPWEQLLSAHDVVRLTRRPRWIVLGLMALGRFPRRRTFHGRPIGWLRAEVADWLEEEAHHVHGCLGGGPSGAQLHPVLSPLPPAACSTRRVRVCSAGRDLIQKVVNRATASP